MSAVRILACCTLLAGLASCDNERSDEDRPRAAPEKRKAEKKEEKKTAVGKEGDKQAPAEKKPEAAAPVEKKPDAPATPAAAAPVKRRGFAAAEVKRPAHFPHRIWAACDFETRLPDYGWFGPTDTKNIPVYPGNVTALRANNKPYGKTSARMTGINPVPGPCMGKVNYMYARYFLKGGTEATFQHFSLSSSDNNNIRVSGLTEGAWSEVTLNFTRDARRNNGSPDAFKDGERMDDLKVFVGKAEDEKNYDLILDDIIFFAEDPALPPESEPFPNRVIYVAGFDTGNNPKPKDKDTEPEKGPYKYFPGTLEIVSKDLPAGSYWSAAKAVPKKDGKGKLISLMIDAPKPVGEHTKLRFRYHLTGTSKLQVQIFDATDQDNRHVRLKDLKQNEWTFVYVDFTQDGKRNSGKNTPFAAGHLVDDIFFFVDPEGGAEVNLLIDEVVLFDAGKPLDDGAEAGK